MHWINEPTKTPDVKIEAAAREHQNQLTKPAGSLGRLEELAIQFAALQGVLKPELNNVHIIVFAGDHGVTEENISAYPQAVTAQMVENIANGGAAISVLAKEIGAKLKVVDVAVNGPASVSANVTIKRLVNGTANFAKAEALSKDNTVKALDVGRERILKSCKDGMQLFIGGEMGIGNTTSASTLAASLLEMNVEQLTGPGTGLEQSAINHKSLVIQQALYDHRKAAVTSLDKLRCFAGAEIVALVGAYVTCAQHGVPILIDGFISSVAALYARSLNKGVCDWLLFSHQSKEPGHKHVLKALKATPIIDLGMRLGEGSGAAVAYSLIKNAIALHNNMATFSEAGVSEKD